MKLIVFNKKGGRDPPLPAHMLTISHNPLLVIEKDVLDLCEKDVLMEHAKFSAIAHRDHIFCSPLNPAKVDTLIGLLDLASSAAVFDSGCGKAEVLIRIVARYGAKGVGVDFSPFFIAEAKANAALRIPQADIALHEMDIAQFATPPGTFDLAICIGSSHLYGGYQGCLTAMRQLVKPGGLVLVGEMYWKATPDPDFIATFDFSLDECLDYAGTVKAAIAANLTPLYVSASSQDDWDYYEWLYCRAVERYAAERPDDPDVAEILRRGRHGRDRYIAGGRDYLGFGLFLLRA